MKKNSLQFLDVEKICCTNFKQTWKFTACHVLENVILALDAGIPVIIGLDPIIPLHEIARSSCAMTRGQAGQ
ncbi:MAG: hypothetical protein IJ630_07820 [Treponema sp.]|nr:hypothetical protein [Treponema sp.]